jgi:hypothetical protein
MIQITPTRQRTNKKGEEVDATIYLERLDSNNLVLKEGETVLNYFGDVRVALKRSLNYALKSSSVHLSLESMLQTIDGMDEKISLLNRTDLKKD